MNRQELIEQLRFGVVTVIFKKVNGDLREMSCTLSEDVIPPTNSNNKKNTQEVLPVWDTNKNAWRSFRLDNIVSILVGEQEHAYTG
tara:strand:- start:128 stop:385 length:258 start_codon:yes stop_codon:yes gene_type:complete